MNNPRVAILGVALASNRAAPVVVAADFREHCWLEGDAILSSARAGGPMIAGDAIGFVTAMDASGPWRPRPVMLIGARAGGPVDGPLIDSLLARIGAALSAAGPLDAVYIANHGALTAAGRDDIDGELIAHVRALVGPEARIVVTLDLQANLSQKMVAAADLIIGSRSNPALDRIERGEEAAFALRLMLAGRADPRAARLRLPILAPPAGLLGDLIDLGARRRAELAGAVLNVSIFAGATFSDCAETGMAVLVTARRDQNVAHLLAGEIAGRAWNERARFKSPLTPLQDAIAMALDRARAPVLICDAGDNPGCGGTGRTTELLSALVWAGAQNVLIGSFFDPPLAAQAHQAGLGARFTARFNSHAGLICDGPLEVEADVLRLIGGPVRGSVSDTVCAPAIDPGAGAALGIGGIVALVISKRIETAGPALFDAFGLDIAAAHTLAVKSGAQIRAAFSRWFPPERIFDVATEGLTAPALEQRQWIGLARPIYPLDDDAVWTLPT